MRLSSLFGPTAAEFACIIQLWPIITLIRPTQGVNYTPVPSPDLDLSKLGHVALTGDFDSISLYTYQQQSENAFTTNGTQALITQLPNGDFATTAAADGYIKALCPFVMSSGKLAGVVVGGNFTELGGIPAQGVAMYDTTTGDITPLPGLDGTVNAILCDQDTNTVYVGGQFTGANSTNAVAWVGMSGWANLPFEGFNGPVNSIIKESNGNVIFGGSFTGLGNSTTVMPEQLDQQVINIASANISSSSNTSAPGFNNPSNIICKTNGDDGPGNTWLLEDNSPGWWRADMNFGYEPSLLRIWNTHQDGRGTQTFRFTAIPINGIMNFTYTDPDTGVEGHCDALCPLSSRTSVPYQDFRFINTVGMSAFRIDVSAWYGQGGGLDGIELFQNDIFAYAVDTSNEPSCANIQYGSNATSTGPWTVTPSLQSNSEYLTANLVGPGVSTNGVSVTFEPDIRQKGNYSVTLFTPGCMQDNTCGTRGIVNVTGIYSISGVSTSTNIYQTNNYDKYDIIYQGPVDANSDSFRPTVTLAALSGQKDGVTLVAQRVQFNLTDSAGGLNGLYEFNPNANTTESDFSNSAIDSAGMGLSAGAIITTIQVQDNVTYVGGNFSNQDVGFENIFSIGNGNCTALPNGGLNAEVSSMIPYADLLFIGGNFTNTMNGSVPGLNNIAIFNTTSQTWEALGAGVSGAVYSVVTLQVNITTDQPEVCVSVNGFFDQILPTGSSKAVSVAGFAIWVPTQQNWLQNLNLQSPAISGQLSAMTNVTGSATLLAGTLSSQDMSAEDAVSLTSDPVAINALKVGIQPQQIGPVTRKRAISGQNTTGVLTGLFYNNGGLNVTVLGGAFTAIATNGTTIDNLALLNNTGSNPGIVSGLPIGLDSDSTFLALATTGTVLYAGGTVSGTVNDAPVNGLIVYDMGLASYLNPQPPAFGGIDVAVNAITVRPNKPEIYVGGNFATAGSLGCPAVCVFRNGAWNQPGNELGGSVSAFAWQGNNQLLAGGNLTINNNATTLATYDASKTAWTALGAASDVPGPVTALGPANNDASEFWVAGKSTNGSAFLMKYDGSQFRSIGDSLGKETTILGLSVLQLGKNHENSDLVQSNLVLLVTGQLNLPTFGNVSAALFNGTTFSPFILSTSGNGPGSLSSLFSEKAISFKNPGGHMAVGFVVLIALACALGAIFLLVVAGILIERYRRKHEGYTPAPTNYFDKTSNMGRIPPEHLFGRLGASREPPLL